jgi:hypothetical protein
LEYLEEKYKKQQQRPNAVPECSLPANEKVDMDDMMTMLEMSRKRMKEIDDGKLGIFQQTTESGERVHYYIVHSPTNINLD